MSYAGITVNPPNTTLPVPYVVPHLVEYFSKGIDEQGPYYKVNYWLESWADSDTVVNALRGVSSLAGSNSSGTVTKRPPHQHPLSPNLFCVSARASGAGQVTTNANGYPDFAACVIEAEYRAAIPYDYNFNANTAIDPGTPLLFCTQEVQLTTETYSIPNYYMKFAASGNATNVPFRLLVPITHLILTFHQLPYIPMVAARALRGRVNSASFLGAAAGCVLFKSANVVREWTADGTVVQKVQLTFAERDSSQQWNYLPDTDLTWKAVVAQNGGASLYPTADLSPLVQL